MGLISTAPQEGRPSWFRWLSKWMLRGIIAFAILIVLFYIEEDLRGAYAWSKTKAELAAQGISLDPQTYIPPPVPESENFGALPIFKLEPDPKQKGLLQALVLKKAFNSMSQKMPYTKEQTVEPGKLPYLGKWDKGEKPDMEGTQKRLKELCQEAVYAIQVPANASASGILELLYPALSELRVANATHPQCRFNHDYLNPRYQPMELDVTTSQILVAKDFSYDERIAIYDNEPQLVLDDLDVEWKVVSGLLKEPMLISGLVAAGVVSIQLAVIQEGLAQHIWNDEQLAKLDAHLGKMDFLSEIQQSLRGDFVTVDIPFVEEMKARPLSFMRDRLEASELAAGEQKFDWSFYLHIYSYYASPRGDYDQGMAYFAKSVILPEARMVDLGARRVYPNKGDEPPESASQNRGAFSCIERYTYTQAQIDEVRIACRLERYRLAHGSYPETLDALVPLYGADLPHDVMNGEPYRYKLNGDGTYVIYSVGWNQKDDGGQRGLQLYSRNSDNLDWIWTNYPDQPKEK